MTKKVMKLIDAPSGLMECKICGSRHWANVQPGGRYRRGSWQCENGCKLEEPPEVDKQLKRSKLTLTNSK